MTTIFKYKKGTGNCDYHGQVILDLFVDEPVEGKKGHHIYGILRYSAAQVDYDLEALKTGYRHKNSYGNFDIRIWDEEHHIHILGCTMIDQYHFEANCLVDYKKIEEFYKDKAFINNNLKMELYKQ